MRDQEWIEKQRLAQRGMSRNKGEANPFFGKTHSPEARAKMSLAHKGKKRPPRSKEWKQRISEAKKGKKVGVDNHFFGKHHSAETKSLISQRHIENPKFRRFGEANGNWKGGVTDSHTKLRNRYKHQLAVWRKGVYERDGYVCRACGQRSSHSNGLNAHHIESFITHPRLRFVVSNGVTLCERCHKQLRRMTILELFLQKAGGLYEQQV